MYRGPYRCAAVSIEGLVQQIAVSYLRHGYWWYVTGMLPEGKDAAAVDAKLIAKYGIDLTERERAFRKRSGRGNMQYVRHDRFYVLMCSQGYHPFKEAESSSLRDARTSPILVPREARPRRSKKERSHQRHGTSSGGRTFEGYAISYRKGHYQRKTAAEKAGYRQLRAAGGRPSRGRRDEKWHARVELERRTFKMLQAYFLNRAVHCSADTLARELQAIPYEPYAPVRQQLLSLVRDVNRCRKVAGLAGEVRYDVLNLNRVQIHPFGNPNGAPSVDAGVSQAA